MPNRAVCCIAESERQAVPIMETLHKSGFSGNEVSVITRTPIATLFPTAAAHSVSRTLMGIGIPETEVRRYEGKVWQGGVLISVQSDDPQVTDRAMAIFERAGLSDFTVSNREADEEKIRTDSF